MNEGGLFNGDTYQRQGGDHSSSRPRHDVRMQPIHQHRRYGALYISERAILYGPFPVSNTEEAAIEGHMDRFMFQPGIRCVYHVFKGFTGVECVESGGDDFKVRPRDPATDRAYYFPNRYPKLLTFTVLHDDGIGLNTCAAVVFRFRTAGVAARVFKTFLNTNGASNFRSSSQGAIKATAGNYGHLSRASRNSFGRESLGAYPGVSSGDLWGWPNSAQPVAHQQRNTPNGSLYPHHRQSPLRKNSPSRRIARFDGREDSTLVFSNGRRFLMKHMLDIDNIDDLKVRLL